MVVINRDEAEDLIKVYREQLVDAKIRLNAARTLKEIKFLQSKINFLTSQIGEINDSKIPVRRKARRGA
ncbi:MAG: hypothetical protein HY516_03385 [Candidatus Aenigmarchaeota archaeon]|nr:hypothetical protein [Candidatus Aenigmarchaeota archaeon]